MRVWKENSSGEGGVRRVGGKWERIASNLFFFVERLWHPVNSTCCLPKKFHYIHTPFFWGSEPWKTANLSVWMQQHQPLLFCLVNRLWRLLEYKRSYYYRALNLTHTHRLANFLCHWSHWMKQIQRKPTQYDQSAIMGGRLTKKATLKRSTGYKIVSIHFLSVGMAGVWVCKKKKQPPKTSTTPAFCQTQIHCLYKDDGLRCLPFLSLFSCLRLLSHIHWD